jgi:hypothetical protein
MHRVTAATVRAPAWCALQVVRVSGIGHGQSARQQSAAPIVDHAMGLPTLQADTPRRGAALLPRHPSVWSIEPSDDSARQLMRYSCQTR